MLSSLRSVLLFIYVLTLSFPLLLLHVVVFFLVMFRFVDCYKDFVIPNSSIFCSSFVVFLSNNINNIIMLNWYYAMFCAFSPRSLMMLLYIFNDSCLLFYNCVYCFFLMFDCYKCVLMNLLCEYGNLNILVLPVASINWSDNFVIARYFRRYVT